MASLSKKSSSDRSQERNSTPRVGVHYNPLCEENLFDGRETVEISEDGYIQLPPVVTENLEGKEVLLIARDEGADARLEIVDIEKERAERLKWISSLLSKDEMAEAEAFLESVIKAHTSS